MVALVDVVVLLVVAVETVEVVVGVLFVELGLFISVVCSSAILLIRFSIIVVRFEVVVALVLGCVLA